MTLQTPPPGDGDRILDDDLLRAFLSRCMVEAAAIGDHIGVMHEGQLSGEFSIEQATQEVLMAAAVGKRDVLKNNLFTL